ncbi:MAG: hypothetical protein LBJ23_07800 [Tannerella sp.]|jgi:hypothetical protein|nr:hypothetical protein [Tannerella sp.]
MKPLLLSFFAVILCYSLFFDRSEVRDHVDDTNYTIQPEAYKSLLIPDSASSSFHAEMVGFSK